MALDDPINALENSLRDLIERVLINRYGDAWDDHLGATAERRAKWEARRKQERKQRTAGVIEERILYYADFTDLFEIIKKNWDPDFKACFGNLTELRVYLEKMAALRNPEAHSRPLLDVEEKLTEGMAGELRQKITLYLSKGGGGPTPERFARIEEIVDSFGSRGAGAASGQPGHKTDIILRPGDHLVLRGRAWDPEGASLTWKLFLSGAQKHIEDLPPGDSFIYEWSITEADVAIDGFVLVSLISSRPYVRFQDVQGDDRKTIWYRIEPR